MVSKYMTMKDNLPKILESIKALPGMSVLVGIPEDKTDRTPEPGEKGPMTNAALGYIHEFGSPSQNIPARPSLIPAVRATKDRVVRYLRQAGEFATAGDKLRTRKAMMAAGQTVVSEVQKIITAGIPPPLADSTLKARARRRAGKGHRINKGAIAELESRAAGNVPSTEFAKPLIDTAQLLKSFTYVIREGD